MADILRATDFKGNGIKEISQSTLANGDISTIFGEVVASTDTEIVPNVRTTVVTPRGFRLTTGSGAPTTVTNSKVGDFYIDTATSNLYEQTVLDTTWVNRDDLVGASPTFATNVPTTNIAAGNPGTASVDNTDPLNPVLSLGLVTGSQGATGLASSTAFIVNQPNNYVELTVDNVGTLVSIEQSILDFSVSKYATGTGFTDTEGKRLRLVSAADSTGNTGLLTGAGETGFSNYLIDNTGTVAQAIATLISEIQFGYVVKAADGRTTNLTWQLSASLKEGTTNVIEFRDGDSDLTLTTALVTNFSPAWTSSNTTETETSQYTTGGVNYLVGNFVHRLISGVQSFFICKLGFTTVSSNGTDNFPGVDNDHWDLYSPLSTGATLYAAETVRTPATLTLTFTGTTFANNRIAFPSSNLANYFTQVSGITLNPTFSFLFGWEAPSGITQGEGFGATAASLWIQGGTDTAITDYVDGMISVINSISTDAAGTEGTLNVAANRIVLQRLCVATRGVGNSVVLTLLDDTRTATHTVADFTSGITEAFVNSTVSTLPIAGQVFLTGAHIYYPATGLNIEEYSQLSGATVTTTASAAELPETLTATWKKLT